MYLYSRCVNGQGFAMNLTLNLETWFKVSEHPFVKDTLWGKYDKEERRTNRGALITVELPPQLFFWGGGIRNERENKEIQSEIEGQRTLRSIRIMVNRNIEISKEVFRSGFCIHIRLLQTFIKSCHR